MNSNKTIKEKNLVGEYLPPLSPECFSVECLGDKIIKEWEDKAKEMELRASNVVCTALLETNIKNNFIAKFHIMTIVIGNFIYNNWGII